jgi:hypothetical protein
MLFSDFLPADEQPDPARRELLDAMLVDFRKAFPKLHFEPRLDRKVINAQAIVLNGKRCVVIYGGLALNPKLGEDSLTFILLHEAGHHCAVGARLPYDLSIACDCVSDYWAAREGANILFRKSGRQFRMGRVISELDLVMGPRQESELQYAEKRTPSCCWNRQWSHRRIALQAERPLLPTGVCVQVEVK